MYAIQNESMKNYFWDIENGSQNYFLYAIIIEQQKEAMKTI